MQPVSATDLWLVPKCCGSSLCLSNGGIGSDAQPGHRTEPPCLWAVCRAWSDTVAGVQS